MKQAEFRVEGDALRDLSPNKRLHWAEKSKLVKSWRARAYWAWVSAGSMSFSSKVCIQYQVRRGNLGRPGDVDNQAAAMKSLTDGLTQGPWLGVNWQTLVPDDSPKWVEFAPIQVERSREWIDKPHVVVRVTQIEGDEDGSPAR